MGLRPEGSNPCRGIRRYRRKGRERFLSDEEVRRLSARLSAHADTSPGQVAVVRLLLLTGCRKSEILTLRWSDYREGHLFLRDSKTGPRTVWLSRPARDILDGFESHKPLGVSGAAKRRTAKQGLARTVLVRGPRRGGAARRPAPRSPPHPRQHRPRAGRDRAGHRQAARPPKPGHDPQIHPLRRMPRWRTRRRPSAWRWSAEPCRKGSV